MPCRTGLVADIRSHVRLANNEIKGLLFAARTEYFMMAGMVVANIPLLYVLNRDWYLLLNPEFFDTYLFLPQ